MIEEKRRSPVQSLAAFFTLTLIAVVAGIGIVLFLALQTLLPFAQEVNQNLTLAGFSHQDNGTASQSKLTERANMFFVTPETFNTQVEKDVRAYAAATGISITEVTTSNQNPLKPTASITVSGGASYETVVQFIRALEHSVPKMTVENLTLTQSAPPTEDSVHIESLTVSMQAR